jgi:TctA family transporter
MKLRDLFRLTWFPVVGASLCCLSSVVVVLFGLGTVSFASPLADTLYGDYKWVFRGIGLLLLLLSVLLYYRKKGVCTLDQAKKRRNEILNTVFITLVAGVLGYMFFLYVVVHYVGVWMQLWR